MKKTCKLAMILFKCSLGVKESGSKKRMAGKILMYAVMLVCMFPLFYVLYQVGAWGYDLFGTGREAGIIVGAVLFLVSAFICFTGIAGCINTFYLSANLETLLVMPFTPSQIVGAKFIVAVIYEYYISFVILAPVLAGYGIAGDKAPVYWIGAVAAILLIPVVPMAYAGILAMVIMRIFGSARAKNRMPLLAGIGTFAVIFLISILNNMTDSIKIDSLTQLFAHVSRVLAAVTAIFLEVPFLEAALSKAELLPVLMAVLTTILITAVFLVLAKGLYFSGAIHSKGASGTHQIWNDQQMKKKLRKSSQVSSYTKKELRMILRDPAGFLQCVLLSLGWPILAVVPGIITRKADGQLKLISSLLNLSKETPTTFIYALFGIVYGITLLTAAFNAVAPTAISREGKSFQFMKQLPISYRSQLRAKRNAALIICGIGSSVCLLIGGIILMLRHGFPWWGLFLGLLFNVLLLIILLDIEMIIGLKKANLTWDSESDILGKNLAGGAVFLIGLAFGGFLIWIYFRFIASLTISPILFCGILLGVLAILALLIEHIFYFYGEKRVGQL